MREQRNQGLLISGESGAGKTETAKIAAALAWQTGRVRASQARMSVCGRAGGRAGGAGRAGKPGRAGQGRAGQGERGGQGRWGGQGGQGRRGSQGTKQEQAGKSEAAKVMNYLAYTSGTTDDLASKIQACAASL